ncbi:MAG: hypothetical protein EAZ27_01045 [Cytophagales bacterium]|nr:MAG: hypothetical protein EAZ27_01045 [Cytophagales bacterium]
MFIYEDNKITKKLNIKNDILNKFTQQYSIQSKTNEIGYKIIHYIYAILHCSYYREKFKELLKSDFPRIPFVNTKEEFEKLVEI